MAPAGTARRKRASWQAGGHDGPVLQTSPGRATGTPAPAGRGGSRGRSPSTLPALQSKAFRLSWRCAYRGEVWRLAPPSRCRFCRRRAVQSRVGLWLLATTTGLSRSGPNRDQPQKACCCWCSCKTVFPGVSWGIRKEKPRTVLALRGSETGGRCRTRICDLLRVEQAL